MSETAEYVWSVHPARERPGAAGAAVLLIFALAWCCYLFGQHEGWALLAVVVLCLSLARFFFPSHYRISGDSVSADVPLAARRTLSWAEVRRVRIGATAAWVSPYRQASFRDSRRGVHLLFGRHAGAVRERLQAVAGDLVIEDDAGRKNAPRG